MKLTNFLIASLFGAALMPAAEPIRIRGSDTMIYLNEKWAAAYKVLNPDVDINATGGGSGLGIKSLINGEADIAAASRPLTAEERQQIKAVDGYDPVEVPVALDAVAVYVHEHNEVSWISIENLRKIYTGQISNWIELGGKNLAVHRYSRDKNSGTHDFFVSAVLQGGDFHSSVQKLPTTEAMRSAVSRNPRAIGYGGIGYSSGVRLLKVIDPESNEAMEPSNINVVTEFYPLSRPLYFYVRPKAWTVETEAFVRWVIGARGQRVVVEEHYYPLPKSRRQLPQDLPVRAAP